MNVTLLVIHMIIAITCAICGVLFRLGKGASIITGYSTASNAKKSIDKTRFLKNCSILIFIAAISFVLFAINDIIEEQILLITGLALLLCDGIASLIYICKTFLK